MTKEEYREIPNELKLPATISSRMVPDFMVIEPEEGKAVCWLELTAIEIVGKRQRFKFEVRGELITE